MTSPSLPSFTIIMPGYNEEANIQATVYKCLDVMKSLGADFELLIIDNASTDRMGTMADELARQHSQIRVIHNPINMELGLSLLLGFKSARKEWALFECMDYHFDLLELKNMAPLFESCDVVNVTRKSLQAHSPYRRFLSRLFMSLVRLLLKIPFHELNFTQIYSTKVIDVSAVRSKSPPFATAELLIRTWDKGARVVEHSAAFLPRKFGTPHYGKPRDLLWTLGDLLQFWIERRNRK